MWKKRQQTLVILLPWDVSPDRAVCLREFYRNNEQATVAQRKFREHRNLRNFNDCPVFKQLRTGFTSLRRQVLRWINHK